MQLLELNETQLSSVRFPETETRGVHDSSKIFSFSRKMDLFGNERQLQDTKLKQSYEFLSFQ